MNNMLISPTEQLYVAELRIPTHYYQEADRKKRLPNPEAFGISKGYWSLRPLPNITDTDGQAIFALTISYTSQALKDAEDRALKAGRIFSSLASGFAAHPVASPKLCRIATVDSRERLISQTNYWYGYKMFRLSEFSQVTQHRFQHYIQEVSSMPDMDRHKLQSAIHWYGNSLTAAEPTVSVVAAWTGLECIGEILNSKYHPDGTRARCSTCGNNPSTKKGRNKTLAGIEHVFCWVRESHRQKGDKNGVEGIIASDLVEDFDFENARSLRNAIVHGSGHVTLLEERCKEVRRHLSHVLNASIQNAMPDLAPSGITGDYDVHPEGRASLKFEAALPKCPYYGDWVEGFRASLVEKSRVPNELTPSTRHRVVAWTEIEWTSDVYVGPVASKCQEAFDRGSEIYGESDESLLTGIPTWDDRPYEPPWEYEFGSPN